MRYINRMLFTQGMLLFIFGIFYLIPRLGNCQNLTINNQAGFMKDNVSFKISIRVAPNAVQSFGFDLHFDPQILGYSTYNRGKIMENYDFMDCVQIRPGVLRCGGFDKGENSIFVGQTGVMVVLDFKKINCTNTVLSFEGLTDDLENWCAGVGRFFCLGR